MLDPAPPSDPAPAGPQDQDNPPPSNPFGTVVRTVQLSPHLIRVVLGGPGLAGFADPQWADSYVNAQFVPAGAPYTVPFEADGVRELPADQRPLPRRYTVRRWDAERRELSIDVVVHGDGGVAGRWAELTGPGDRLQLRGPAGAYRPDPTADWHLLVGDGSALPAVAVALERLPAGVPAYVVLQVPEQADEVELASPAAVELHWVHAADDEHEQLLAQVAALQPPAGRGHAFVHGEAVATRAVRRLLLAEWGLARKDLSVSAYWRYGHTDEQWRQVKGAWNRAVEQDV